MRFGGRRANKERHSKPTLSDRKRDRNGTSDQGRIGFGKSLTENRARVLAAELFLDLLHEHVRAQVKDRTLELQASSVDGSAGCPKKRVSNELAQARNSI